MSILKETATITIEGYEVKQAYVSFDGTLPVMPDEFRGREVAIILLQRPRGFE